MCTMHCMVLCWCAAAVHAQEHVSSCGVHHLQHLCVFVCVHVAGQTAYYHASCCASILSVFRVTRGVVALPSVQQHTGFA
jgi:hypothetical protein